MVMYEKCLKYFKCMIRCEYGDGLRIKDEMEVVLFGKVEGKRLEGFYVFDFISNIFLLCFSFLVFIFN